MNYELDRYMIYCTYSGLRAKVLDAALGPPPPEAKHSMVHISIYPSVRHGQAMQRCPVTEAPVCEAVY